MSANLPTAAKTAALAGAADLAYLSKAADVATTDMPASTGGDAYLRMLKDGSWVYGAENIEVEPGSLWLVDPMEFERGYTCWTNYPEGSKKANELLGEIWVPMHARRPDPATLPEHIDPDTGVAWKWQEAMAIRLTCVEGEDTGVTVQYKANSVGGKRLLNEWFEAFKLRLSPDHPDHGKVYAIVKMTCDHYQHKKYGKTYTPEFDYVEWVAPPAQEADDDATQEAEPEPEVVDEAPAEEQPRRRRRPA